MSNKSGFTTISSHDRGFTLIELLIVISIIAVLSTIGLVSYKVLLQNSRDGKRQADLGLIQSALEQYHSDQFAYPLAVVFGNSLKDPTGTKTYLGLVPKDPLPNSYPAYRYVPLKNDGSTCSSANLCTSYCLYTSLENDKVVPTTNPIKRVPCYNNTPGPVSGIRYNFALSPF